MTVANRGLGERYPGLAGFARAWRDWVSPYTSFFIDLAQVREAGT